MDDIRPVGSLQAAFNALKTSFARKVNSLVKLRSFAPRWGSAATPLWGGGAGLD